MSYSKNVHSQKPTPGGVQCRRFAKRKRRELRIRAAGGRGAGNVVPALQTDDGKAFGAFIRRMMLPARLWRK